MTKNEYIQYLHEKQGECNVLADSIMMSLVETLNIYAEKIESYRHLTIKDKVTLVNEISEDVATKMRGLDYLASNYSEYRARAEAIEYAMSALE